jgi:hypothetical protein
VIVRLASLGRNLRNAYWIVVFVLLTFSLIAVDFTIVTNYLQVLQESYLWEYKPANLVLSDILFIEGAVLLVAGAVFAGFSLYTMIIGSGDKLKYDYVKSVFNWETIKKEQAESSTMKIGLVLLGVGVVCISVAVIVTL